MYARSVTHRMERLRADCEIVSKRVGNSGPILDVLRSLSRVERRTNEWKRVVRLQQKEARRQHAELSSLYRVSAAEVLTTVAQAARAAAFQAGVSVAVATDFEDALVDRDAADCMASPSRCWCGG